jgi:hypothetical protein
MGIEVLIPIVAIISVLLIPILGITVILTTRFALRPLAETLASALRESGLSPGSARPEEIRELSEQVQTLAQEVRRLQEVQDFDRKLLEGSSRTGSPSG